MFVNKLAERRTVDEERGVHLHCVSAGCPERPAVFVLTVAGTPIGFAATSREIQRAEGSRVQVWTVHKVGVSFNFWLGPNYHQIPAHRFATDGDRAAVLALIDEALRVYRFAYGMNTTPVEDVVFEAAAKGA